MFNQVQIFRKIILLISSFTIFTSFLFIITKAEITSFLNKCSIEKLLLLAVMFVNVKNHGQPWNRLCLTLKQCIDYTIFLLSLCDELNMMTWICIPVNPPSLSGSLPRKSLISRIDWVSCTGDINLPHDLPPTKKSSTIKSWPTFCDQYFWKFPIWNSRTDEKRREIRMVKVFKWYPVIDLFDTFTSKLGHGD